MPCELAAPRSDTTSIRLRRLYCTRQTRLRDRRDSNSTHEFVKVNPYRCSRQPMFDEENGKARNDGSAAGAGACSAPVVGRPAGLVSCRIRNNVFGSNAGLDPELDHIQCVDALSEAKGAGSQPLQLSRQIGVRSCVRPAAATERHAATELRDSNLRLAVIEAAGTAFSHCN